MIFSCLQPESCISKYNDPHAYCVVYSSADRSSLECAEKILQALWTLDTISTKAVILVANKADLVRSRVVSTEGKLKFCSTPYFPTSNLLMSYKTLFRPYLTSTLHSPLNHQPSLIRLSTFSNKQRRRTPIVRKIGKLSLLEASVSLSSHSTTSSFSDKASGVYRKKHRHNSENSYQSTYIACLLPLRRCFIGVI